MTFLPPTPLFYFFLEMLCCRDLLLPQSEYCSLLVIFATGSFPVVLDASFLSSRTTQVFFSFLGDLWWFQIGAGTWKKDHICLRTVQGTSYWRHVFILSLLKPLETLHLNLGNHPFIKQNLSSISRQLFAFLCFMGILNFFKNAFL